MELLGLLVIGFFIGITHAMEADHLAAVASVNQHWARAALITAPRRCVGHRPWHRATPHMWHCDPCQHQF